MQCCWLCELAPPPKRPDGSWACDHCGFTYWDKVEFIRHQRIFHPETAKAFHLS